MIMFIPIFLLAQSVIAIDDEWELDDHCPILKHSHVKFIKKGNNRTITNILIENNPPGSLFLVVYLSHKIKEIEELANKLGFSSQHDGRCYSTRYRYDDFISIFY